MSTAPGFLLHLTGIVQGVGFRPFVYQKALESGLSGTVSNGTDGLKIRLFTSEGSARKFLDAILQNPPTLARITSATITPNVSPQTNCFRIVESERGEGSNLLLPPDFGLCDACRTELHDPTNHRYRYPFITCTNCGPRYSIIHGLPYDRPTTAMRAFAMCPTCREEYHDPTNRRFYSQTNSCAECGPQLSWFKSTPDGPRLLSRLHDSRWIIPRVANALKRGKVVAVKGIGGFLLLCDARNTEAVELLRRRKHRPTKPFALLYPSVEQLEKDAYLSPEEVNALQSVAAPIVLVRQRATSDLSEQVAPKLTHIGVMVPYAPLLDLIAQDFGGALVATSGNLSGNPIIYQNNKALEELSLIADYVLTHNRDILLPQDDSVIRFTENYKQPIILRRGRGLSPNYHAQTNGYPLPADTPQPVRLAFGASLKSTFALQTNDNRYVSQYLGDLESAETQDNFRRVLDFFLGTCKPSSSAVSKYVNELLTDAHEGYFSTQLATELGSQHSIPVRKIQHHEAHFAAVLAENGLHRTTEPILGVIWDGTGFGTDGHIWGGEFFVRQVNNDTGRVHMQRQHLAYFDAFLGDKMPREPRLSALSLLKNFSELPYSTERLRAKFSAMEWSFYQKLLIHNTLKTSSMGRLFDGIAALLGLADKVSYEGEAALLLEEAAARYLTFGEPIPFGGYFSNLTLQIDRLLDDIDRGCSPDFVAARLHYSLVELVENVAQTHQVKKIAFSGGVFQNAVLVDLLNEKLRSAFTLYFHRELSPNDENIAFGQLMSVA